MSGDLDYYMLCKRTDPSYTVEVAIAEYASEHPEEASDIARQYWEQADPDSMPMDWDDFRDYLEGISRMDVFLAGLRSGHFDWNEPYVCLDGYGNPYTIDDAEYREMCLEACGNSVHMILNGDIGVSRELSEVISLFVPGSPNRKPSAKRAPAKAKKAPAKPKPRKTASGNRKKAPAKGKTPTKKTSRTGTAAKKTGAKKQTGRHRDDREESECEHRKDRERRGRQAPRNA